MKNKELFNKIQFNLNKSKIMNDYFKINEDELLISNFIHPDKGVIHSIPMKNTGFGNNYTKLQEFMTSTVKAWELSNHAKNWQISGASLYTLRKAETAITTKIKLPEQVLKSMLDLSKRRLSEYQSSVEISKREIEGYLRYGDSSALRGALYGASEQNLIAEYTQIYINALTDLINGKRNNIYMVETVRVKDDIIKCFAPLVSINPVKGKTIESQYKLNSFKNQNKDKSSGFYTEYHLFCNTYISRGINIKNTIEISKLIIEQKPQKEFVVNLETVYPQFEAHIQGFTRNYNSYFNRDFKHNTSLLNGDFHVVWHSFNDIKVKLMLLGYKEKDAVQFIIDKGLKVDANTNKCYNYKNIFNIGQCSITGQIMPEIFLTKCKRLGDSEPVTASYYYVVYYSNHNMQRYSWNESKDAWIELQLHAANYHGQTCQGHTKSALEYLTPVSTKDENIMAFGVDKMYQGAPFLGVELEVERNVTCQEDITEAVFDAVGRSFIIIKQDGTLRGHNPFEIVSVPATLEAHKANWAAFMDNSALKGQLTSYVSGRCGMHVHISRECFTGLHIGKFLKFINAQDNSTFIHKLAGRAGTSFNKYTDFNDVNQFGELSPKDNSPIKLHYSALRRCTKVGVEGGKNGHYDAVSTSSKHGTIEVRIFRGNLAKSHFYKNIEFVHALWAYTKNCSMRELDYKDFILWIFKENCKLYNNLQAWLIASGYNVSNRNSDTKEMKAIIKKVQLVVNKKYNSGKDGVLRNSSKVKMPLKSELLVNM